jgi:hypothetical protein
MKEGDLGSGFHSTKDECSFESSLVGWGCRGGRFTIKIVMGGKMIHQVHLLGAVVCSSGSA